MSRPFPPSYEEGEEGFYFQHNSVYSINRFKNSPCCLKYIRAQYIKWLRTIAANPKRWHSQQVRSARHQIAKYISPSQRRRNRRQKSAVITPSEQLHSEMERMFDIEPGKQNLDFCGVENQEAEENLDFCGVENQEAKENLDFCRTPGQRTPSFEDYDNISTGSEELAPTVILSEVSSPVGSIAESMPDMMAASLLGVQEIIQKAEGIIQEQGLVTAASLVGVETMIDNLGGEIVGSLVRVGEMIQKAKGIIEGQRLVTAASLVGVEIMIQTAEYITEEQRLLIIEKKKELSSLRHRKESEAKVEALIKTQLQLLEVGIQLLAAQN